jgi:hypothetical protein
MNHKPIFGATILTRPTPTGTTPAMLYKGAKPKAGDVLQFAMSNGVTYSGTVADATEADGGVLVEFVDGLTPELPQKPAKVPEPDTQAVHVTIIPE